MKEIIFEFWDYSLEKRDDFTFSEFFDKFNMVLYEKLASHCYLGLNAYIEVVMKRHYDIEKLRFLEYKSVHTDREFNLESIVEAIFRPRYEHHKKRHEDNKIYQGLLLLYYEIKHYMKFEHSEKVFLVDKCIHAIHNSGFILEIDELRKEYDAAYL